MEPLPHIDEHARVIAATPDRTWSAVLWFVSQAIGRPLPRPLVAAWGLEPPERGGDWAGARVGATIPGFALTEVDPPRLLVLRGRHRFSRYELRFSIDRLGPDRTELRAVSRGEFPGALGTIYRGLVIGSRGHVLAVRGMLARIAGNAERVDRGR